MHAAFSNIHISLHLNNPHSPLPMHAAACTGLEYQTECVRCSTRTLYFYDEHLTCRLQNENKFNFLREITKIHEHSFIVLGFFSWHCIIEWLLHRFHEIQSVDRSISIEAIEERLRVDQRVYSSVALVTTQVFMSFVIFWSHVIFYRREKYTMFAQIRWSGSSKYGHLPSSHIWLIYLSYLSILLLREQLIVCASIHMNLGWAWWLFSIYIRHMTLHFAKLWRIFAIVEPFYGLSTGASLNRLLFVNSYKLMLETML